MESRTAEVVRQALKPIASSTSLGADLAALQALPALTRSPAASNTSSMALLLMPGTEKFKVVGKLCASGTLKTMAGKALRKACSSWSR